MNSFTELLSKIDFKYWNEKNPYFSQNELNGSMKGGLSIIQNQGFLVNFEPTKSADYVDEIDAQIRRFKETECDYKILANIFDLIQAWGGKTGRVPYVITKSRFTYEEWKGDYLEGAQMALGDEPVKALKAWLRINGLGMSFAPKHLRFWSKKYPVLDTRISLLLCGSTRLLKKPEYYADFLELIAPLKDKFASTNLEVEKALFTFSQNYFLNGKLLFKTSDFEKTRDLDIAKKLTALNPE